MGLGLFFVFSKKEFSFVNISKYAEYTKNKIYSERIDEKMNSDDINKKFWEIGINPQDIKGAEKLFSSEKGRKIAGSISKEEKQRLLKTFMSMDTEEIRNRLKNADLSKISQMSSEDILKKLR